MSEHKVCTGWSAALKVAYANDDHRAAVEERLGKVGVRLNIEGTIAYYVEHEDGLAKGYGLYLFNDLGRDLLIDALSIAEVPYHPRTVTQFLDVWYTGTDSNHTDLALADYMVQRSDPIGEQ